MMAIANARITGSRPITALPSSCCKCRSNDCKGMVMRNPSMSLSIQAFASADERIVQLPEIHTMPGHRPGMKRCEPRGLPRIHQRLRIEPLPYRTTFRRQCDQTPHIVEED